MRQINYILLAMFFIQMSAQKHQTATIEHKDSVMVCYGKLNPNTVKGYTYLIIEAAQYTKEDIIILKRNNTHVLAYLSLGEVHPTASFYKSIQSETIGKNDTWGSAYLNITCENTRETLMIQMQNLLDKGCTGFFLDNLDNYTIYGPMTNQLPALITLLERMKCSFPYAFCIQNAGLPILQKTASSVDAVLIESVATAYDFNTKTYQLRPHEDFNIRKQLISDTLLNITMPLFLLEYADTKKLEKAIQNRLASTPWPYCINTIDLQSAPMFNTLYK